MSRCIDPKLPLEAEVRRIAQEEMDVIVELLESAPEGRQRAVHGVRKRLKKLRALLKLVRRGNEEFYQRENRRFRDLGRSLSTVRDADALVETAERFITAAPERHKDDTAAIRDHMVRRRDHIVRKQSEAEPVETAALADIHDAREAFATLALRQGPREGKELVLYGAQETLAKARKALKRARKKGEAEDFHELRKAMKAHRTHLDLLETLWPGGVKRRRKKVDVVGDRLGDLNDIAAMHHALATDEQQIENPAALQVFRKLLAKKENALRKICLRQAAELLEDQPKLSAGIDQKMRKAA